MATDARGGRGLSRLANDRQLAADPLRRLRPRAGPAVGSTLEIVQGFSEIRFGVWEGRGVAEVHASDPLALAQFWRDPIAHPIPESEPVADFDRRVGQAWATLLERHRGQHVLLVAHGGTIRMVLRRILDMPLRRLWRFEVPFAALSRVHWFHDPEADPRLVFHNGRVT